MDPSPQLQTFDSDDEAIKAYFRRGYTVESMQLMLSRYHDISISERSIYRRLAMLNLHRRNSSDTDDIIERALEEEIRENGNYIGYRQMTVLLKRKYNVRCTTKQIGRLLRELDPEACKSRRGNKLVRRVYRCPGVSHVWHMDGFDKLKPYGCAVHGCIDGYSRRILWLKVAYSNNDPKIIAGYYLQCILEINHGPKLLRSDFGTENGIAVGIQAWLCQSHAAHLYGKSTANQRIESFWSKLKPSVQGWIDFFHTLVEEGHFHPGDEVETACIRYCFLTLIQQALDNFTAYWNSHTVRKSSDSPGGIPDVLFFTHRSYGFQPDLSDLNEAAEACQSPHSLPITGDSELDNYFNRAVEQLGICNKPSNQLEAFRLYEVLLAAAQGN